MNEAETRAEHYAPALKAAGWGVVEGSRVMREYRITEGRLQGTGQRSKPKIADYVLAYHNHKLAGVKDYFTIYDFVKAHHLFNDLEWDGDAEVSEGGDKAFPPIEPRIPSEAKEPPSEYQSKPKVRVKLRDCKERTLQHISVTTFWGSDGKPISSAEFMTVLFGQLPKFFKDEDELRALWCLPDTRKKLLEGLAEKGFGKDQLFEMHKIIDAENSDLFDVLAHVAFAMQPITREARAEVAHQAVYQRFSDKQQTFLDFVLAHYVQEGVEELQQEKLTKLVRLKYHDSIPDGVADLGGDIAAIRNLFSGFQRYLYQGATDAKSS